MPFLRYGVTDSSGESCWCSRFLSCPKYAPLPDDLQMSFLTRIQFANLPFWTGSSRWVWRKTSNIFRWRKMLAGSLMPMLISSFMLSLRFRIQDTFFKLVCIKFGVPLSRCDEVTVHWSGCCANLIRVEKMEEEDVGKVSNAHVDL